MDAADEKLARAIHKRLKKNASLTVQQLALELKAEEADVARVIDEHQVEDGKFTHAGPGGGGGWVEVE